MSFKFKSKSETENKTIRFPREMIEQINAAIGEGDSFSSFVIQACRYALENMESETKDQPGE